MEIGKHRVDPRHAEHARAENDDHRRHDAAPDTARGGDAAVHQRADAVGKAHDAQALHARVDDLRLVGEDREELPPEEQEQHARASADKKRIEHADPVALFHAVDLARAPVAADEAGAGRVERGHHVEEKRVGVRGGGVSGDHHRIERVDADLHEQVRHGKDGVLQAGGNADHQHAAALRPVKPELRELQAARIRAAQQMQHDQQRRQALRDGARDGDARRRDLLEFLDGSLQGRR